METQIKLKIKELRDSGVGYGEIAKVLNIGKSTIASYCKRYNLRKKSPIKPRICKQCKVMYFLDDEHKDRDFCSKKCRAKWKGIHSRHKKEILKIRLKLIRL